MTNEEAIEYILWIGVMTMCKPKKRKIIVVYNKGELRHIIDFSGNCEFWSWYYSVFSELPGDTYRSFFSMKNANRFADRLMR